MTVPDPYKVLGVTHDASTEEIKRAYRLLALQLHPDRLARVRATPEDINRASTKFAAVTSAYALLTDEKRKREYDHIYKYGGFDETPARTGQGGQGGPSDIKKKAPQMGIGYAIHDPFKYILSKGKERSTTVAGISIPSRFNMVHSPEGGFRISISSGQFKETPTGSVHVRSRTTQFAAGKKFSKTETTTIHRDGQTEVLIEGDDYVERKFCTIKRKKQIPKDEGEEKDDLTHATDDLPWYLNAWRGFRDGLEQVANNPCGRISVR